MENSDSKVKEIPLKAIDFHRLNEIDLSILSQQMQKELFTLNEKNK